MKIAAGLITFLLSMLLFLCTPLLTAQDEPDYTAKVRLVEFIIQATDSQGNHVKDLQKDEIEISTAGIKRQVAFLSAEDFLPKPLSLTTAQVCEESSFGFKRSPRYILFLLHKIERRIGSLNRTRKALQEFLEASFSADDYYSLVTFDKGLDARLEFTNNREKLLEAVSDLKVKLPKVKDHDDLYKYLVALSEEGRMKRGRLNIILLTEGLKGTAFSEDKEDFDEAIKKLQAANIRVYAVDTGGLNMRDPGASVAALDPRMASKVRQSFNNGQITDPTGGISFRRGNDIRQLLDKASYSMNFYYVCGFYLKPGEELSQPLSLEVKTDRQGVKLRY
jgi:VWFA-related protein